MSKDEFLIAQAAVTPEPIPGDDAVSGDAPVAVEGAPIPGDAPDAQAILPIIPEGEPVPGDAPVPQTAEGAPAPWKVSQYLAMRQFL